MEPHLQVQEFIYVEVSRIVQLLAAERGNPERLLLKPGSYEFYIVNYDDKRPEREWAILLPEEKFGTPISRLKSLDRAARDSNDMGPVEVTYRNGKAYFDD